MSENVKKNCPITGSEIAINLPDPNELVITQRKGPDGKYGRAEKPRKEVKGALSPEVSCPNSQIPASADLPLALEKRLMKEKRVWCKKRKIVCPIEEILHKLGFRR